MSSFLNYNNILFNGFINHSKSREVIEKKQDLLLNVLDYYNLGTDNILFVGFSPWCLSVNNTSFCITEVDSSVTDYLTSKSIDFKFQSLAHLVQSKQKFDIVVAVDEYFTFADDDNNQRQLVDDLASITNKILITTLRDYKNQDFKDREFSQPIMIRGNQGNKIYLEHFDYDIRDKNASQSKTYVFDDQSVIMHGPFVRRNMYFKQLAKFSLDAGANNFYVHKNLMYKSVIKKNYEHVITIKF